MVARAWGCREMESCSMGRKFQLCKMNEFQRSVVQQCHTGIPCFIVLHFIALCRYCVFYKLKGCDNPASSKSIGAIFPAAFVCVCHNLVILATFQTILLLLYLLWWICDSGLCLMLQKDYDLLKAQRMASIV